MHLSKYATHFLEDSLHLFEKNGSLSLQLAKEKYEHGHTMFVCKVTQPKCVIVCYDAFAQVALHCGLHDDDRRALCIKLSSQQRHCVE